MKNKTIASILLLGAIALFSSCSDDNAPPPQSPVKQYPSLVTNFLETYGFRTFDSETNLNQDKEHREKVPVEGVESYEIVSDIGAAQGKGPAVTVNVGKPYTHRNNPHGFNSLLEKYGDTDYRGIVPDTSTYRPHPVAITGIHFTLTTSFEHTFRPFLPPRDYNKKYTYGSDCTSLFIIRYRTYYDYIRNGYSWEGLGTDSPWKEMDLEEFNRRGGDKLIDMTRFYLFPKEPPANGNIYWHFAMTVTFENGRTNVRNRYLDCGMGIDWHSWADIL